MTQYTFIDFETTGLDAETSFVIEIAAVKVEFNSDGSTALRDSYQTFCRLPEEETIPDFIEQLTGITHDDIDDAPSERRAMQELIEFIGDSVVVAHHAPFELSFIKTVAQYEPERFVCTRVMSRLAEPDKSASLAHVCERHGIENERHHRALADVMTTIEVFRKLRDLVPDDVDYENHVIDSPDRPLTFKPKHTKHVTALAARNTGE